MRALLAVALLGFVASCSQGTYALVTFEANGAAPAGVKSLALQLTLDGKSATTTFSGKSGADIAIPTTASLEVRSGVGQMHIVAIALDAHGVELGRGSAMGTISSDATTKITVVIDFGQATAPDMTVADDLAISGDAGTNDAGSVKIDMAKAPPLLGFDHQPQYDFGTVVINQPSSPATLTVTNSGGSDSGTLGAATLSGTGMAAYSVQTDNCMGKTLTPGASCTVLVVLSTPTASTPKATLTVSAAPGGDATVALTGDAVMPGAISLSASPSASPSVVLPGAMAQVTVTVHNSGGVQTGGITWGFGGSASGDYSVIGGTCTPNQTLAASGSCALTVQFAPVTAGPRNATLTVAATPGGPGVLQLTGVALTPAAVSFTQATYTDATPVVAGSNATMTLTLQNTGTAQSANLPATIQTTGHTDFVYLAGGTCVLGAPLAGSSMCTILVKFQPSSYGSKGDTLALNVGGAISAALAATGQQTFSLDVTNVGATGTDEITSKPANIACGPSASQCSVNYTVTTTAPSVSLSPSTVDPNSRFGTFSGDCTGATCSLTITKNETVTATWHATFVAKVTIVGSGIVTSTSSPAFDCMSGTCGITFDVGTSISLTAMANSPNIFTGWSVGCTGTGACTLNSATPDVTATFPCPSVGSTVYVDHTNGTDDATHGSTTGTCAYKTLAYALAHATGNISLLAADTFPGGVAGEPNTVNLTGTQGLICNGATFDYLGGTTYMNVININGTANTVNGCVLDGNTTSGNINGYECISVTTSGAHSIVGNTLDHCLYGVNLGNNVTGVTVQSNTITASSGGIALYFSGGNGATLTGNNLNANGDSSVYDVDCAGSSTGLDPGVTGSGNYHYSMSTPTPSCTRCAGCPFH